MDHSRDSAEPSEHQPTGAMDEVLVRQPEALAGPQPRSDAQRVNDEALQSNRALALRIAEIISDTPASDTRVLAIHELSPFADFFVICSGDNERQLRAIQREILERLQEEDGVRSHRVEGTPASGWTIVDFVDVIVHIFDAEQRAFYRLEQLWADAPTVLSIQ